MNKKKVAQPEVKAKQPEPTKEKRTYARSQQGSVIPRTGRNGRRSFRAVFRSQDGKQKWMTFPTRAEAVRCLEENVRAVRQGKYVGARAKRFAEYLSEWLSRRKGQVKPNTWHSYKTLCNKWILPAFKRHDVRDVTTSHVRLFANQLILENHLKGKSIRCVIALASLLFHAAVQDGYAESNPCEGLKCRAGAERQKDSLALPSDSKNRHVPCREEVMRTFAELDSNPAVQVFLAMLTMTGCRKGEALGLFWDDISWDTREIQIERSLCRAIKSQCDSFRNITWVNSEKFGLVPPKTKKSMRRVNMPDELMAMLLRHRATVRKDSPYVFQDRHGGPMHPATLYGVIHEAQDRAGVKKRFEFHALRHLHASELFEAGASAVYVRDALGHCEISMTDKYAHRVSDGRRHASVVAGRFNFGVSNLLEEGSSQKGK